MFKSYIFYQDGSVKGYQGNLEDVIAKSHSREVKFIWLGMFNLTNEEIQFLEEKLKIHPLEIEDALQKSETTPKIEEHKKHLFVSFINPLINKEIESEKISFFVFKKIIIVIRNKDYSLYKKTHDRIISRARYISSPASILHIFLDTIVDNILLLLDKIDEDIGELESRVMKEQENVLESIYMLKDRIITLRRMILPMKEVVYNLSKHSKFVSSKQVLYFRDIYEHLVVAINQLDLFRDSTTNLVDLIISLSSQRLNESMKILTAITTIFLPLTLITGIYGMNFKYMPEINHPYGYYFTLIAMLLIGSILFYIFKKKRFI